MSNYVEETWVDFCTKDYIDYINANWYEDAEGISIVL